MKVTLFTDDVKEAPVQLIAVGAFADEPDRGSAFASLNQWLDGALAEASREEIFEAKPGQQVVFNLPAGHSVRRVMAFGLGDKSSFGPDAARRMAAEAVKTGQKVGATELAVQGLPDGEQSPEAVVALVQALAEGALLGSYKYTEYLSDKGRRSTVEEVKLAFVADDVHGVKGADLRGAVKRAEAVTEGVRFARDLVNMPPNELIPAELADRAKRMAKRHDLTFKVLHARDLERQGMNLHLGVGKGSTNEPKLIHLTYTPSSKSSQRVVALVGKGLTFDAGGLSLKTSEGMMTMKIDMGGAAAVLGAMEAIAISKPDCIVHGVIGAAENMPDGNAIRPGDVITGKKGVSVEILNTDAEGRLVLADALAYAQDLKPTEIIDLATLTGACMVALGPHTAGAFVRDEALFARLEQAWQASGEKFWRMPLERQLREMLESDIADIKNIGERWGGAITAALFLSEFVDSDVAWAHLDVAGPVFAGKAKGEIPKGGTGFAVRTLVELIHQPLELQE
ncbi:MAG: leucyl aminopeptidase [Myxococcota bacterium]